GDVWVGVTVKPVAIQSLREFDAQRYADLDMLNPVPPASTCPQSVLPMPRGGLPPDSQSGAFVLTYANAIHPFARSRAGRPLYDGYLAIVASGPSTPIRQCAAPIPQDDPRRSDFESHPAPRYRCRGTVSAIRWEGYARLPWMFRRRVIMRGCRDLPSVSCGDTGSPSEARS